INFHFAGKFFSKKEYIFFLKYIKENNLNNVKYYGVVDGNQKKALFVKSDIFILPTYYHIEGQPISLIEAMANGLTVITTNHAGIPDIVSEKNGFIIEPKNEKAIEKVLLELSGDIKQLKDIALFNRKYVNSKFKEIDYIKRLEKIFKEV
ncbi:glycosyltransferase, partial [Kitasatospora sp. SC0581]|uniref:glycosyltransferase n=1 Tax=Kitasatospora sp. SC0581 TaxID=3394360 RepID=UPI003A8B2422